MTLGPETWFYVLPRQLAYPKIEHHVAYRLKVVPSRQLVSFVSVYRSKSRVSSKTRSYIKWYVSSGSVVDVFRSKTEVNQVYLIGFFFITKHKVFRFNVPVDIPIAVKLAETLNDLDEKRASCLQTETLAANLKHIVQRGSEKLGDQESHAKTSQVAQTYVSRHKIILVLFQLLHHESLMSDEMVFLLWCLCFNSYRTVMFAIDSYVDFAKWTFANFTKNVVPAFYDQISEKFRCLSVALLNLHFVMIKQLK